MKAISLVNEDGYFIEDVLVDDSFEGIQEKNDGLGTMVAYAVPNGLYKPRWDFKEKVWIEGLTKDEITVINQPAALSEADKIRQEMAEQNAAMWDFILSGGAS